MSRRRDGKEFGEAFDDSQHCGFDQVHMRGDLRQDLHGEGVECHARAPRRRRESGGEKVTGFLRKGHALATKFTVNPGEFALPSRVL
jgi:hypothetical protein